MKLFQTPITVRFRDIDAMGHVNNAVFFTYFEEGRKSFFFGVDKDPNPGFNFILAHISCDYLKPVEISSKLSLQVRVSEIGRKSFNFSYRLINADDEGLVYATGASVQVCYDYRSNKTIEVSDDMRQKLMEYSSN